MRAALRAAALLALGLAFAAAPALARTALAPPPPRPEIPARLEAPADATASAARPAGDSGATKEIVDKRRFSGEVGFALIDVETGEILESRLPKRGFPPASTIKAVTALYALDTLGAGHRFTTSLVADGAVAGGVLKGDLYLHGGGDPELDSDDLADLIRQGASRGLKRVDGRFLVDATALPQLSQIDDDQPADAAYNPSVAGLNLNFNRVLLDWGPKGEEMKVLAQALRTAPEVATVAVEPVESAAQVFEYDGAGKRELWRVAAPALRKKGKRWLPVRRAAPYAGDAFRAVAAAEGVALPAPGLAAAPLGAPVIGVVRSRPLRDMVRLMLKHSTNLTAEAIGLSATVARGVKPADLAASGREMEAWARSYAGLSDSVDMRVANHSGLSPDTRITPEQFVRILRAAELREPDGLNAILRRVDLKAGRNERKLPLPASAAAKTGTMNFVRGLGGYIDSGSGRRLAFAIFSEDLARREAADNELGRPRGARTWSYRAQYMERALVRSWAARY